MYLSKSDTCTHFLHPLVHLAPWIPGDPCLLPCLSPWQHYTPLHWFKVELEREKLKQQWTVLHSAWTSTINFKVLLHALSYNLPPPLNLPPWLNLLPPFHLDSTFHLCSTFHSTFHLCSAFHPNSTFHLHSTFHLDSTFHPSTFHLDSTLHSGSTFHFHLTFHLNSTFY